MDFLSSQIQYHEEMIQTHLNQIKNLKKIKDSQMSNMNEKLEDEQFLDEELLSYENDLIWDRIKKAHPEKYMNEETLTEPHINIQNEKVLSDEDVIKENKHILNEDNLYVQDIKFDSLIECDLQNETNKETNQETIQETIQETKNTKTISFPLITKLSKFSQKKQNQIIKNIFTKASDNINELAKFDSNIASNLNENIKIEADRLLNSYLDN